jgi:hypothetical protein
MPCAAASELHSVPHMRVVVRQAAAPLRIGPDALAIRIDMIDMFPLRPSEVCDDDQVTMIRPNSNGSDLDAHGRILNFVAMKPEVV